MVVVAVGAVIVVDRDGTCLSRSCHISFAHCHAPYWTGDLPDPSEDKKFEYLWNCRDYLIHAKRCIIAVDMDKPGQVSFTVIIVSLVTIVMRLQA